MKAVFYRPSSGLVFEEVPDPVLEPDQVLVEVADTGFCGSDHSLIESGGLPDGYILGHEFSGRVVEVGSEADAPPPGTRVIVRPTFCGTCPECLAGKQQFCQQGRRSTGIGDLPGGFAQYVKAYPQMLIKVPERVDSRNAALAEVFAASLHGLNCSGKEGGSALVIGGGPIGLALVRLLKIKGFSPIVLSEPMSEKRDLAAGFGADFLIDPFSEGLAPGVLRTTQGLGFKAVFECSGRPENVQASIDAAARFGTVVVLSVMYAEAGIMPLALNLKEVWLTGAYGNTHGDNIRCLNWMAEGQLDGRPMISDLISLEDLPRVYRERIHTGKAVKVMIRIGEEF